MVKLVFIVANQFRDEELVETKSALSFSTDPKFEVDIASTTTEQITGKSGAVVTPNTLIDGISAENYDGIVVIGGPGMYDILYNKPDVAGNIVDRVKDFSSSGKLVAAICIGPIALAKAGIISDMEIACWNDASSGQQKQELEAAGATFSEKPLVVEEKIITANGPDAAHDFGNAIREFF